MTSVPSPNVLLPLVLLAGCGGTQHPATPRPSPAAVTAPPEDAQALARQVYEAAGGSRLASVAEVRFRFAVLEGGRTRLDAHHRWDLRAGRDHVTWNSQGLTLDAVVDLTTREARGTVDGLAVEGDARVQLGRRTYARWVNDSYWLMMPLKLLDPGVQLRREAPAELHGRRFDVLHLAFDHVGLTPGDQYWLWIDPATARVARWEMLLEGQPQRESATWDDYRTVGPLVLARAHNAGDNHEIITDEVDVLADAEPTDFVLAVRR